jgi:hypothetical protein
MPFHPSFSRFALAAVLLGSLGACTVVPAYPAGYRATPVYVETYPAYRAGYSGSYYQHDRPYYGDRGEHHYQEQRRSNSPFDEAARAHRDVRRSLGLPRLPGMP